MKKVFLDFGANKLQGYEELKQEHKIDNSWEVHAYEPNPSLTEYLQVNCPNEVTFHNKAVWKANETLEFVTDIKRKEWQGSHIDQGSSSFFERVKVPAKIKVEAVDVFDILNQYSKDDKIIVKMDIEASEFEVLPRMIDTGQMEKVNELYVEFHCRMFGDKRSEYRKLQEELVKKIKDLGVKLTMWK